MRGLHLPRERAQRRAAHVPCQLRVLKQPVVIGYQHQGPGFVLDDALRMQKTRVRCSEDQPWEGVLTKPWSPGLWAILQLWVT